jgi:hypothetical protein
MSLDDKMCPRRPVHAPQFLGETATPGRLRSPRLSFADRNSPNRLASYSSGRPSIRTSVSMPTYILVSGIQNPWRFTATSLTHGLKAF